MLPNWIRGSVIEGSPRYSGCGGRWGEGSRPFKIRGLLPPPVVGSQVEWVINGSVIERSLSWVYRVRGTVQPPGVERAVT